MINRVNFLLTLVISTNFFSCNDKIGPALSPEVQITYGILDKNNQWNSREILTDSVSIDELDNTLMIDILDIQISDLEDVEFIKENWDPDGQQIIRTIEVETLGDKEVFTDSRNVFSPYSGYGMNVINGIEHYDARIGMLIPIRIGKSAIVNNDTLELSLDEVEFILTRYRSPINDLETSHIVFFK